MRLRLHFLGWSLTDLSRALKGLRKTQITQIGFEAAMCEMRAKITHCFLKQICGRAETRVMHKLVDFVTVNALYCARVENEKYKQVVRVRTAP